MGGLGAGAIGGDFSTGALGGKAFPIVNSGLLGTDGGIGNEVDLSESVIRKRPTKCGLTSGEGTLTSAEGSSDELASERGAGRVDESSGGLDFGTRVGTEDDCIRGESGRDGIAGDGTAADSTASVLGSASEDQSSPSERSFDHMGKGDAMEALTSWSPSCCDPRSAPGSASTSSSHPRAATLTPTRVPAMRSSGEKYVLDMMRTFSILGVPE